MIVKQVQTITFSKDEQEALTKAANIIGMLCVELDRKCSCCPFNKMCEESDPAEVIAKLGHEGRLIIEEQKERKERNFFLFFDRVLTGVRTRFSTLLH